MKKLKHWTPDIDPATIPDQVLTSEWGGAAPPGARCIPEDAADG
jgi:hypothetical protein